VLGIPASPVLVALIGVGVNKGAFNQGCAVEGVLVGLKQPASVRG
jgi:hypothetical protein